MFPLNLSAGIDINVTALKSFRVSIPKDRNLSVGQTVTIKILAVAYTKGVPDISGELVSTQVKLTGLGWL